MNHSTVYRPHSPVAKLAVSFLAALAVATAGLYAGQWVPAGLYLPLYGLELVLLLVMMFARVKKRCRLSAYVCVYVCLGGDALSAHRLLHFHHRRGGGVQSVCAGRCIVFRRCHLRGENERRFSFLGGFLMLGAFALLGLLIIQWFIPFSSVGQMGIAALGILIFLGFTIYDINRLARYGFTEADIPMIVVNIYLDFINLFVYILRFFASDED